MFRNLIIPLKYKFLAVLLMITLTAIAVFFSFTNQIFSDDKKLFVMDLNLTLLRAATSEIKLELRTRLEEMQIVIPRIYKNPNDSKINFFEGVSKQLPEEVLRVRFYRRNGDQIEQAREYLNLPLLESKKIPADLLNDIDKKVPLRLDAKFEKRGLDLINRSIRFLRGNSSTSLAVLTVVLPGSFVESDSKEVIIAVDLIQDFLRKRLHQSEVAQLFLINKQGILLSHGQLNPIVDTAGQEFPHPVTQRLKVRHYPRESFETEIGGDAYLCNLGETGFPEIYIVSQIKKSDAFAALRTLMEKSVLIAALILFAAAIISVLFASRLTANIALLKQAAEEIGQGNLRTRIKIHSNDEIQSVSESFEWMSNRLQELMTETAQKARMEEELATARLVQSTLLSLPEIHSDRLEFAAHYLPATECGGDVWDAWLDGNTLTLFIADATGHGAPAAIVTAVAKSCFTTLNTIYAGQPLAPEQILSALNTMIYSACKGKLLMTMCLIQLDLESGELKICNAGHESPLCLRRNKISSNTKSTDTKREAEADVLLARGERLGFDPDSQFESTSYKLGAGDTILLFTDGISEAEDGAGKQWGERRLKKAFARRGPRPLNQLKDQIVEELNEHTNGVQQKDDITFVLFTLKAARGKVKELEQSSDEQDEAA